MSNALKRDFILKLISSERLKAITKWESGYDFMSGLQYTKTILEHNGL